MNPEPRELEIDELGHDRSDYAEPWTGSDYLCSWIGAGIFALCLCIGVGECARRSELTTPARRGTVSAAPRGEPVVEINPTR